MKIPRDVVKIYDMEIATFWIDSNGIYNSIAKKVPRTLQNMEKCNEVVKSVMNGEKIYALVDVSHIGRMDKHSLNYIKNQANNLGAMAVITGSVTGKMAGTILMVLMPPSVPTRLFHGEPEAREWLLQLKKQNEEAG